MRPLAEEVDEVMTRWLESGKKIRALARKYQISLSLLYQVKNGYIVPKKETEKRLLYMVHKELHDY